MLMLHGQPASCCAMPQSPPHWLTPVLRPPACPPDACRGEGWCLPLAEAMSMGLPSIATNWSGPTAFLDESVGYPLRVDGLVDAEGPAFAGGGCCSNAPPRFTSARPGGGAGAAAACKSRWQAAAQGTALSLLARHPISPLCRPALGAAVGGAPDAAAAACGIAPPGGCCPGPCSAAANDEALLAAGCGGGGSAAAAAHRGRFGCCVSPSPWLHLVCSIRHAIYIHGHEATCRYHVRRNTQAGQECAL